MSGKGLHVHGPHDHEVEHAAQHGPGMAQRVAIFTAILATGGAVVSFQGGEAQHEALMKKNDAVLHKTEAANQWAFYQSKSTKGHMAEMAAALATSAPVAARFHDEAARYDKEKAAIKTAAEELEREATRSDKESEQLMGPHRLLMQSITLVQIAISLASITVLTGQKWMLWVAGAAAAGGAVLWGMALLA